MADITIQGIVTKVHKKDKDTGFCIVTIKGGDEDSKKIIQNQKSGRDTITLLGTYFNPNIGEHLTCEGYFKNHAKFGHQFSAQTILSTASLKQNFPEEILRSDIFRQIKEVVRKEIYKKYGDESLGMITSLSAKLAEDGFISNDELKTLREDIAKLKLISRTYNYLRGIGLSEKPAFNVLEARGNQSAKIATSDPYDFLNVPGVGFKSLNNIADTLGMDYTSKARLDHCFDYVLVNHFEQGHTGFPIQKLALVANKDLGVGPEEVKNYIKSKIEIGEFIYNKDGRFFSTYKIYEMEKEISSHLLRIKTASFSKKLSVPVIPNENNYLKDGQINAIKNTLLNKLSVITGGPGVGKTTVVKYVMDEIKSNEGDGHRIILAAPTGKAARRMSESTGIPANTIHTLLDYHPDIGFRKGRFDALKGDTIIIDESSMVDLNLFYSLLESIPSSARLIIVGDVDQLASVGAGAVLKDIIDSGKITVSKLTETVRQGKESQIVYNAQKVNNGEMAIFNGDVSSDFIWIDAESDEDIKKKIRALTSIIPAKFGIQMDDVQVLSPQKDTPCGVNALNAELNDIINPKGVNNTFELKSFGRKFRVNDRVMQVRNDKTLKVNNGDLGVIKSFDLKKQTVKIKFDEFLRELPIKNLGHMRSANAITIHKSQGCEYDAVIMPISMSHSRMLSRQLVYTGMTRASKLLIMVGSKDALREAISNTEKQNRITGLKDAIIKVFNEHEMSNKKEYNQSSLEASM